MWIVLTAVLVPTSFSFALGSCQTPVAYSLGTIDSRFNLSRYEIIQKLILAEKAWEEPSKKDLFIYVAEGGVRVNFVYDARQAETDAVKAKLEKLALIKTAFDGIHASFTLEASSTEARQKKNSADFATYKADESVYNAEVAAANAQGGASGAAFENLASREAALRTRFTALKSEQDALNQYIARMNILSGLLNQLAQGVNTYVVRYNASLKARGVHEAGLYSQRGAERLITVYEFANSEKLIRTLAHELGHALGLEHISDAGGIMYASNSGESLLATDADLSHLDSVCSL